MASNAVVGILRVMLTANAAEFEAGLADATKATKKWSSDLKKVGDQAKAIGQTLTAAVTVPLVGLGAGAIKAATDFESSFAGIRKTVGDATDDLGNLTPVGERLAAGMRALAKEIPINVNELNRIGEAAGQLGIKSENILGFTRVMADLGVATNLSSEQAAMSLARLANIMQMPQTEFDRLGSTVVALGNNLEANEGEITEFGLRIAGAGKLAGLSVSEILAIGTAMATVGVEAEAGGTAVQKVLMSMTQAVNDGGEKLDAFAKVAGMSAAQFAERWRQDAAGAFRAFVEGLGQQGQAAFGTLAELELQDIRLQRAFLSLAGAGDKLAQSIGVGTEAWQANTALTKEAEQRYQTTENQVKLLWAQMRDLGIEVGTTLLPIVRDLVTALQPAISVLGKMAAGFAALPEPVRLTVVGFTAAAAAAGPVIYGIGAVTTTVAGLVSGVAAAPAALMAMGGGLSAVGVAALGAAPQLLAFGAAAASVVAIGAAVRNAIGLVTDRMEQNRLATEQNVSHQAALAAASQVSGRSITDLAEAHRILAEHNAALRAEMLATHGVQEQGTATTTAATTASTALAEATEKLATAKGKVKVALEEKQPVQEQSTLLTTRSLNETAKLTRQLEEWARVNSAQVVPSIRQVNAALTEQSPLVNSMTANWAGFAPTVQQNTTAAGSGISGFFSQVFGGAQGLSQSITGFFQQAFVSGAGATGAIKAFATQTMSTLLGMIPGVGQWAQMFAGPIVEMLSKLGPKIKDFFRGLFGGPSRDELNGRNLVAEFEANLHGMLTAQQKAEAGNEAWKMTVIALRDAYIAQGRTEEEALRDAERLWASSRNGAEASRRVIEEIQRILEGLPPRTTVDVDVNYNPSGEPPPQSDPGYAVGTIGRHGSWFQRFPTGGVTTRLHGTEAVITPPQAPAFAMDVLSRLAPPMPAMAVDAPGMGGAFQVRVPLMLDGLTFAEALVEYIPTALKRRGV